MYQKYYFLPPTGPVPPQKAFLYSYDYVGRLSSAVYKDRSSGTFALRNYYNETLTYDENGNIATLQRNNLIGTVSTLVDNLAYTYKNTGKDNQLDNVTDAVATNTTGYGWRNYTGSTGVYTYDDNGNLLTDPKKGTTLTYNELDKTTLIQKTATKKIEYKYDASGVRITKIVTNGAVIKTTEYVGGFVTENSTLLYYGAPEGRVRNDAGVFKHEYMITDWQGNVRLSFEDNGSGVAITRQESSYYAFGMQIAGGYTPATNANKKLYNAGSELQDDIEEGMADYYSTFFREYDAVLGRFNGVDMAAAELHDWGVYQYSYNNPVNFNDPMGDNPTDGGAVLGRQMQQAYENWREGRYGSYRDILTFGYLGDGGFGGMPFDGGGGGSAGGTSVRDVNNRLFGIEFEGYITKALRNIFGKNAKGEFGYWKTYTFIPTELGYVNMPGTRNGDILREVSVGAYKKFITIGAILEEGQIWLDGVGMTEVPILSQAAELASAGISVYRKDYLGAGIGVGSMVPLWGKGFEAMKLGRRAEKALEAAKNVKKFLPSIDATGKLHGTLIKVKDFGKYTREDLEILLKDLNQSVQKRIEVTSRLGRDRAHGQRQGAEQDLIKSLEKYLGL